MWMPEHRRAADRHGLRYPSDLSDSEWALIEPVIPPAKRGGRRREMSILEVLNAICYYFDGLPVAGVAEGFAAEKHGAFLLRAVGVGRHAGAHPPRALCRDARARRPRGQSDGRDHRQPGGNANVRSLFTAIGTSAAAAAHDGLGGQEQIRVEHDALFPEFIPQPVPVASEPRPGRNVPAPRRCPYRLGHPGIIAVKTAQDGR